MNEEILKRLDLLASKFNTTAEHLWLVLIRQSRISGIEDSLFLVICCFLSYLVWQWVLWIKKSDGDADPLHYIGVVVFGVILTVLIIVDLYSIPTELLNPEYYAFKEIMGAIK